MDRGALPRARAALRDCGGGGREGAEQRRAESPSLLTSLAGQFAWHAELLFDLLPTRAGTDATRSSPCARPGADDALDALDELAATDGRAAACVVLARVVVPRLLAGVASASARVDARLDGPRARALTLIARDLATPSRRSSRVAEARARAAGEPLEPPRRGASSSSAPSSTARRGARARRARRERPGGLTAPVE